MVKNAIRINRFCIIFTLVLLLLSCDNSSVDYAPPQLIKGEKPTPTEDLSHLKKLFKRFDGNLLSEDDVMVRWKDTKMFRMFEFKHHTIVVFPYNWDLKGFNLIIFAGRVLNYNNLFESIRYKYKPNYKAGTDYFNNSIVFNLKDSSIRKIGFEGFYFGDSRKVILKKQMPRIERRWNNDKPQKELRVSSLTAANDHVWGRADKSKFDIHFQNDRVVYMNFWIEGFPQLGGYSIEDPFLPVIDQGEFKIGSSD
jgi:hypothetical protein